jgi:uncharacterized protein
MDHNGLARIEVPKTEIKILSNQEMFDKIVKELKSLGFKFVTVDLQGYRTGSMLGTLDE